MAKRPQPRPAVRSARRKALLVGINRYPTAPLKGCVNDALMVGNLLIEQFGFQPGGDMRLLVDDRATKAAILERLRWLVEGARAGDILVFHYSGHGAQVADRTGDEVDRLDECLCPFDFTFDNPLLDDDLAEILRSVPGEANLTVILDCCHSGTGTRELFVPFPAQEKRLLPPPDILFRRVSHVEFNPAWGDRSVTMTRFRELEIRRLGSGTQQNAVLIAGCRSDQLSKDAFIEGDYHGASTFSLFNAIQQRGIDQPYADLVPAATSLLKGYGIREQDPQLEGPPEALHWKLFSTETTRRAVRARAAATKQVVYVHGICRHDPDFSLPWFEAMRDFTPSIPAGNRHEVLWSDIVNPVARGRARAIALLPPGADEAKQMIIDLLADRAERLTVQRQASRARGRAVPNQPLAVGARGLFELPTVACIDDFMKYLFHSATRARVIEEFHKLVRPLLKAGETVEVISHSWGTVVAYEALRLLDGESFSGRVHNLFTVGSALSIRFVQFFLPDETSDGAKPAAVDRWINLDAENDIVGGTLAGKFDVDEEFLELRAVGCDGGLDFSCAHRSYFHADNAAVNRDVFGRLIEG